MSHSIRALLLVLLTPAAAAAQACSEDLEIWSAVLIEEKEGWVVLRRTLTLAVN